MIRQAEEGAVPRVPHAAPTGAVHESTRRPAFAMSPQIPTDCPHELRPGVTVCLHCRRNAQEAQRSRWIRVGMRAGTAALVVAIGAGIVAGRGSELQESAEAALIDSAAGIQQLAAAELPPPKPEQAPAAAAAPTTEAPKSAPVKAASVPAPAASSAKAADVPLEPLVAPGRTDMGDGLYVERAGQTVTVHFDTPQTRTRRRDKFERVVRRTLPEVYGSAAEVLLSSIPEGTLVEPVDLVTELAERGVKLDAGDGWKVSLWPETRPGSDGPLVVSYRVAVTR